MNTRFVSSPASQLPHKLPLPIEGCPSTPTIIPAHGRVAWWGWLRCNRLAYILPVLVGIHARSHPPLFIQDQPFQHGGLSDAVESGQAFQGALCVQAYNGLKPLAITFFDLPRPVGGLLLRVGHSHDALGLVTRLSGGRSRALTLWKPPWKPRFWIGSARVFFGYHSGYRALDWHVARAYPPAMMPTARLQCNRATA